MDSIGLHKKRFYPSQNLRVIVGDCSMNGYTRMLKAVLRYTTNALALRRYILSSCTVTVKQLLIGTVVLYKSLLFPKCIYIYIRFT